MYQILSVAHIYIYIYIYLELQTTIFKWLFQLDVSTSLLEKLLFHQTSIQNWLFRVPGISYTVCSHHSFVGPSSLGAKSFRCRVSIHHPVFIGTPTGRCWYIYIFILYIPGHPVAILQSYLVSRCLEALKAEPQEIFEGSNTDPQ